MIEEFKGKMLQWYMETCDVVPKEYDERFTFEFLENNMTSVGVSKVVIRLLAFYLRMTGKSASRFIADMRRKNS